MTAGRQDTDSTLEGSLHANRVLLRVNLTIAVSETSQEACPRLGGSTLSPGTWRCFSAPVFRAGKLHVKFGGVFMDKSECSSWQKLIRP